MTAGNVIVFAERNFQGRSRELGIGTHRFFASADFNDVISSIKVPAGLVAMVFEHADDGGGFGTYVDLLEDRATCPSSASRRRSPSSTCSRPRTREA